MDVMIDEIVDDFSQEFMTQMGIIKYHSIQKIRDGIEEWQFFFKDKKSLDNYLEEFDLHDQVSISV